MAFLGIQTKFPAVASRGTEEKHLAKLATYIEAFLASSLEKKTMWRHTGMFGPLPERFLYI